MIYLVSDTHFGHSSIIGYCERPFTNVEEMDEELIRRWNAVVTPTDEVYHLGDFAFRNQKAVTTYLTRLNGHIHVVPGGHDSTLFQCRSRLACWHDRIITIKVGHLCNYDSLTLCHYPMLSWPKSSFGQPHAFGHVHSGKTKPYKHPGLAYDVGVDNNDYRPISVLEFIEKVNGDNVEELGWYCA